MFSCLALVAFSALPAPYQVPAIERVVAIEEADSPVGRYRVVLTLSAPLSRPRNSALPPELRLGAALLRFPGPPRDTTTLFAYVDDLPAGPVPLRIVGGRDVGPGGAEITIDPRKLLEESRLLPGEFEPSHVERSLGTPVDLGLAWDGAELVCVGRFLRGDVNEGRPRNAWDLTFDVDGVLKAAHDEHPERLRVVQDVPFDRFELGARYLVCCERSPAADPVACRFVRLWQVGEDSVLAYAKWLAGRGGLEDGLVRDRLWRALESPAAEVRFSAAGELGRMQPQRALTADEVARVRARASLEPSAFVRQALLALADHR